MSNIVIYCRPDAFQPKISCHQADITYANPSNHTFQDLIEYEKFENADAINNPVAKKRAQSELTTLVRLF